MNIDLLNYNWLIEFGYWYDAKKIGAGKMQYENITGVHISLIRKACTFFKFHKKM